MGIISLDPVKYGHLCKTVLPKVIENDREFDRFVAFMESLDRKARLTPEENALRNLLAELIQHYDDTHHSVPDAPPYQVVLYLMEQKGLRQADLLPVFGSRSVASAVLNGKRELSKTHIRKLAEFFHLSAEAFL